MYIDLFTSYSLKILDCLAQFKFKLRLVIREYIDLVINLFIKIVTIIRAPLMLLTQVLENPKIIPGGISPPLTCYVRIIIKQMKVPYITRCTAVSLLLYVLTLIFLVEQANPKMNEINFVKA